jgi:hypothetical protein
VHPLVHFLELEPDWKLKPDQHWLTINKVRVGGVPEIGAPQLHLWGTWERPRVLKRYYYPICKSLVTNYNVRKGLQDGGKDLRTRVGQVYQS